MKLTIAGMSIFAGIGICLGQVRAGQNATPRDSGIAGLAALATNADVSYCFARVRGLDPGRQPTAYIDLQLRVMVSYQNAGARPLILPLERETTSYYGFKPEAMSPFREDVDLLQPAFKAMKELPTEVSQENPINPKNDVFTVIPAGGDMTPALLEEVTLPVNRVGLFRRYPDLRGHRVYIKLQFAHRDLAAALKARLSEPWSPFGMLWTGTLTTNTFVVDVPSTPPAAAACIDPKPAHPASTRGQDEQRGK
jgi:hypothetical protein